MSLHVWHCPVVYRVCSVTAYEPPMYKATNWSARIAAGSMRGPTTAAAAPTAAATVTDFSVGLLIISTPYFSPANFGANHTSVT